MPTVLVNGIEIAIGENASLTRVFSREDMDFFALITGDAGPSLVDGAKNMTVPEPVTHGWFSSGLIGWLMRRLPRQNATTRPRVKRASSQFRPRSSLSCACSGRARALKARARL